jgi:hypothetical protein
MSEVRRACRKCCANCGGSDVRRGRERCLKLVQLICTPEPHPTNTSHKVPKHKHPLVLVGSTVFVFWHFVRGVYFVRVAVAGSLWCTKLAIVRCVSYSDV